jgi:NADPH:quinone reductase-like Zn-dependent oxidoreductase
LLRIDPGISKTVLEDIHSRSSQGASTSGSTIFKTPGLENLKVVDNVEGPKAGDHDILIKVKAAGVNPIDYSVVSGSLPRSNPIPHIPGAELSGIAEEEAGRFY